MPRKQYTLSDRVFEPKRDCAASRDTEQGGKCIALNALYCAVEGDCGFYGKQAAVDAAGATRRPV